MAPSISMIQGFTVRAREGEVVRHVALPDEARFLGVMPQGKPPRIFRYGTSVELPFPVAKPAVGMVFRPTAYSPEQDGPLWNPEAAVVLGDRSAGVVRVDLELRCALADLPLGDASAVAYSHDGQLLAAGAADGTVKVWSLEDTPVQIFHESIGHHRITALALSARNDRLYAVNCKGDHLWVPLVEGATPGVCLRDTYTDGTPFQFESYAMTCHPTDNDWFALGGDSDTAYLVNYATGEVFSLATALGRFIRQVEFVSAGQELAVVGETGAEVWDLASLEVTRRLIVPVGSRPLAARQYGGYLYLACA